VTWQLLTRIAADGPGIGRAELSRITCPVLVVGHTHDLAHPLAACEELAGLIPHARLVRITPKAIDREAYVSDFKSALATFLKDVVDGTT
jgi:pimeloyl-ACP methyl ester carboxylesterase